MMFSKKYIFSGLCFEIISETAVEDSNTFPAFRGEGEPDITVYLNEGPLPEKKGELLFDSGRAQYYLYEGKEYMYSRYYIGKAHAYKDFAMREINGRDITLYMDYDGGLWDSMVFEALGLPDILILNDRILIHSSYIIYNGKAILFAADKLVGKSTQASLWEKHAGAVVVNGDRAILRFEDEKFITCATPFCGSSKISLNLDAPLGAIVLLGQGCENIVEKISGTVAFGEILGKFTYNEWSVNELDKAVSMAQLLSENAPVYRFSCVKDGGAVETLRKRLKEDGVL